MNARFLKWTALVLFGGAAAAGIVYLASRRPAPHPGHGFWSPAVTTVAGRGVPGSEDGPTDRSAFSDPFAVAVGTEGNLYVADAGDNNLIRRIKDHRVTTIAGGFGEALADGRGRSAAFHTPSGIAVAPHGTAYVADTGNHAIRRISPDGVVTTLAGSGAPGYRDGDAVEAAFNGPIGITSSPDGSLFVADTYNDRIRRIDPNGFVSTVAGSGEPGFLDGAASSAQFDTPSGVAFVAPQVLVVADTNNRALRRIDLESQTVTTIELSPATAEDVSLVRPVGVAAGRDRAIFVTDSRRNRILHVLEDGSARVLAGSGPGFADGDRSARFFAPAGIVADREGALIVADAGNHLIRRIAPPGLYPPDPPRSPLAPVPGPSLDALGPPPLLWPIDPQLEWHEVAGTMGEPRGNFGGDGRERFHAGVDVKAHEGELVRAIRGSKVDNPVAAQAYGTINESLSIGPITYVHMRVGRDRQDRPIDPEAFVPVRNSLGEIVGIRVRRGARFGIGDALGTVNRFGHVHLNVGRPGREVNPLALLLPEFRDTIPPRIAPRGVLLVGEDGIPVTARTRGRLVVRGRVRVIVDAWDRADGNTPNRRLGLYRVGYQLLHPDGSPAVGFDRPRITMVFDRLPQNATAPALIYAPGSGISEYSRRRTRYLYVVTNRLEDGNVVEDLWDTRLHPPGHYTLRVLVADAAGNEARDGRDVAVTVEN